VQDVDINYVAVVVAALVPMFLGALWYSTALFARPWMQAVDQTQDELKGAQLGYVGHGILLVVSGVYYPVDVLPGWMQAIAKISPATYALDGVRGAILDGRGLSTMWGDIWPLLIIGTVCIPLGLWVFSRGEQYAKRHGKLKRSG